VNSILSSHIRRVEELGTGAAYCQLLHLLFPGQVPISRVKFDPKQESDCLDNFKIICSTFTKLKIEKRVDIDRLVSLKFQDNLIFLHWFKKFFDKESKERKRDKYDAVRARGGAPLGQGSPRSTLWCVSRWPYYQWRDAGASTSGSADSLLKTSPIVHPRRGNSKCSPV